MVTTMDTTVRNKSDLLRELKAASWKMISYQLPGRTDAVWHVGDKLSGPRVSGMIVNEILLKIPRKMVKTDLVITWWQLSPNQK